MRHFGAGDLVLKVRREEDVSLSRLSSQCAFSEYLAENGIRTARFLSVCPSGEGAWKKEGFAAALPAAGGPVLVTLEHFCVKNILYPKVKLYYFLRF